MSNYKLSTPSEIANSAGEANVRANAEPNQSSYNAAWLHGYADALREVAQQMSDAGPLEIKVLIEDGCTQEVFKNLDIPVDVELICIDKDYEDYEQLCEYADSLQKPDSGYRSVTYTVAHFDTEEEASVC